MGISAPPPSRSPPMKSSALLVFLPLLAFPAAAIETRWTAAGTVTSVTGTGLTATVGAPVNVKFSYDSGATLHAPVNLPGLSNYTYYGAVNLQMEVAIGESKWSVSLPATPPEAPAEVIYAEGRNNATDILRVTGGTSNSASFPSFPYTGSATSRSVVVELRDNHAPSLLLKPQAFPNQNTCNPSTLSSATGEIKAGTDSIKFNINLTSVTVETGTQFKVTIERTATGVRLRWPTETGVFYTLNESENSKDWDLRSSYDGDGQERVVEIPDAFTEHPRRCFYRVESE